MDSAGASFPGKCVRGDNKGKVQGRGKEENTLCRSGKSTGGSAQKILATAPALHTVSSR